MERESTAVWNGSIKEEKGHITSQSKTLDTTPYSFISRFEEGSGTNPEELMAAAHAGCFTMKLSLDLVSTGFVPESLATTATVTQVNGVIKKIYSGTVRQSTRY
jgi:osmotically inducible protein OsmC